MTAPLLEVVGLTKDYRLPRPGWLAPHAMRRAVDGVSLTIRPGRSFGVVGESGSGKSTLARAVMALEQPTAGLVRLDGHSLFDLAPRALRAARAEMQMIFQDPYGSLDPRQRVRRIVAEPLINLVHVTRVQRAARVLEALRAVGLVATDADKYPHEFSGGQRQRIAIARALVTRPKLVVADEPVSALDVSIQAQVLNLMSDLQREAGPAAALFKTPRHPYTRELVDAAPKLDEAPIVAVDMPPGEAAPGGCAYAPRCRFAQARCREAAPDLRDLGDGRSVACHFPL